MHRRNSQKTATCLINFESGEGGKRITYNVREKKKAQYVRRLIKSAGKPLWYKRVKGDTSFYEKNQLCIGGSNSASSLIIFQKQHSMMHFILYIQLQDRF